MLRHDRHANPHNARRRVAFDRRARARRSVGRGRCAAGAGAAARMRARGDRGRRWQPRRHAGAGRTLGRPRAEQRARPRPADEYRRGAGRRRGLAVPACGHVVAGRRGRGGARGGGHRDGMGTLRCAHRRGVGLVSGHRRVHELAFTPHRHRHRRPGHLRADGAVPQPRRLRRAAADGGRGAVAPPVQGFETCLLEGACAHIGTPVGDPWRVAHDSADVAPALGLLARCLARGAGAYR